MLTQVTQLGRYRLGEQIGAGGMAEVFRGELSGAEGFSRPVAIKRVRAKLVGDTATAHAFIEEARLAQRLQHGNIVQTHDLGIEAGVPYIVMEFVDGLSLADVIMRNAKTGRRLGVATTLYIIEAVAEALDYAHRLSDADGNSDGVVHRDVNPRNILLSADGIVKLTDFGIAKGMNMKPRTLPGRVKGTLGYLSPEQAYGGIIGPPTDQFATGVVLYQLLAGHNPLAGAKKIKEYRKMLDEGLPHLEAPDVDDELRSIVHRATASKVDARFTSMSEFRQTLEAWRVARGVRTSLDGVRDIVRSYRGKKVPQRAAPSKLDDALLAQLGDESSRRRDTRMISNVAPEAMATEHSKRRWPAVALALGALVALVAVVLIASGSGDDPAEAAAPDDDDDDGIVDINKELAMANKAVDDAFDEASKQIERADEHLDKVLDGLHIDEDDETLEVEEPARESDDSAQRAAEKRKRDAEKRKRDAEKRKRDAEKRKRQEEERAKAERKRAEERAATKAEPTATIRINVLP